MEEKDERYLNVTLKNETDTDDDLIISLDGIFKMMKKYFLIWIVTAVIAFVLVMGGCAVSFKSGTRTTPLTSLVSFTYNGIEKGLDPAGNVFDVNSIKNPLVIEKALTNLGRSTEEIESIRQNIKLKGIMPEDAVDRITAYKSIFESASSTALTAAKEMLDVTYYPTQYTVEFDYSNTDFKPAEAVQVLNEILDCYRNYFFDMYGYNESVGNAATALDYKDYDYAEAVDVFNTTLTSLKKYVDTLSSKDNSRYRSVETGNTFADLSETIKMVQSKDIDLLSSYIVVNNVTKNKDALVSYYQYRIDALTRAKSIAEEKMASINDSIASYQKNDIVIFGNDQNNADMKYTEASEQYDRLFELKTATQTDISTDAQQIGYYSQRIAALNEKPTGSNAQLEKVEEDVSKLNEKVNSLIDVINKTADEYFEKVELIDAYNVLVPASYTAMSITKGIVRHSIIPEVVAEAVILVIYLCVVFVQSLVYENKKKKGLITDKTVSKAKTKDKTVKAAGK